MQKNENEKIENRVSLIFILLFVLCLIFVSFASGDKLVAQGEGEGEESVVELSDDSKLVGSEKIELEILRAEMAKYRNSDIGRDKPSDIKKLQVNRNFTDIDKAREFYLGKYSFALGLSSEGDKLYVYASETHILEELEKRESIFKDLVESINNSSYEPYIYKIWISPDFRQASVVVGEGKSEKTRELVIDEMFEYKKDMLFLYGIEEDIELTIKENIAPDTIIETVVY